MSERDEGLLEQRLSGHSSRAIAKRFRCDVADVDRAVDALPEITNEFRVRNLKLELERLDRLLQPFWEKAIAGDCAAGTLVVKICERKCELLGINSPIKVDAVALAVAVRPAVSGTERIYAALARLSNGANGSAAEDVDAPGPAGP